jgi:hypothetical protein
LASFIVHPDYILEPEKRAQYKALLSWLCQIRQEQNLWLALPGEIDSWWRARSRMSIVKDGESWRVAGEGAERAVMAFARSVDGRLVYELPNATQEGIRPNRAASNPN